MPSPTNAPAPPPALVASAKGELPEDIAEAIGDFSSAERAEARAMAFAGEKEFATLIDASEAAYEALAATILGRLTAADTYPSGEPVTDLDHARYDRDGWMESALRAQGYVGELQGRLAAALARAERAEKAIRDYLSGDYPNPRSHRPGKCEHGTNYWDECAACDCAHFEAALAHPAPAEEEKP